MTLEERVKILEDKVMALEFENRSLRRNEEHRRHMDEWRDMREMNETRMKLGLPLRYPEVRFGLSDDAEYYMKRMEQSMQKRKEDEDSKSTE